MSRWKLAADLTRPLTVMRERRARQCEEARARLHAALHDPVGALAADRAGLLPEPGGLPAATRIRHAFPVTTFERLADRSLGVPSSGEGGRDFVLEFGKGDLWKPVTIKVVLTDRIPPGSMAVVPRVETRSTAGEPFVDGQGRTCITIRTEVMVRG